MYVVFFDEIDGVYVRVMKFGLRIFDVCLLELKF